MIERITHEERVRGCLYGGAVGDAFGYAVEFTSSAGIRRQFGPEGIREPVEVDGKIIVSDDTQMTMFTMEGMIRAIAQQGIENQDRVVAEVRNAYLDWLLTQDPEADWQAVGSLHAEPVMRCLRAPGNTCLSALRQGGWGSTEPAINNSKGCGGVMRVAPMGLVPSWRPLVAFHVAARAAALTHGHPSGYWSAAAMAAIIAHLCDGLPLRDAVVATLPMLSPQPASDETVQAMGKALRLADQPAPDRHKDVVALGEGWIGEEALAIGLYAALVGRSFAEVLAIAANHGGDSDSTASIAGQLVGTWRGLSDLPSRWVERLDVLKPLDRLIDGFIGHVH